MLCLYLIIKNTWYVTFNFAFNVKIIDNIRPRNFTYCSRKYYNTKLNKIKHKAFVQTFNDQRPDTQWLYYTRAHKTYY